ncbi:MULTISPECIES: hypothetical protein [Microbacterium]|uniref:hypothetical protein n=1 Tax=Microbacterium TaxID=33882 RepID=UPI00344E41A0
MRAREAVDELALRHAGQFVIRCDLTEGLLDAGGHPAIKEALGDDVAAFPVPAFDGGQPIPSPPGSSAPPSSARCTSERMRRQAPTVTPGEKAT